MALLSLKQRVRRALARQKGLTLSRRRRALEGIRRRFGHGNVSWVLAEPEFASVRLPAVDPQSRQQMIFRALKAKARAGKAERERRLRQVMDAFPTHHAQIYSLMGRNRGLASYKGLRVRRPAPLPPRKRNGQFRKV